MAQYDLLLTQNTHATGTEFTEKTVNIGKGDLLSGIATTKVPTVLAAGTNGYMLVRDDAEATGLKWIAIAAGHTQGTDAGTTATVFELDTDGYKIELTAESASKMGIKVDGGATYADLQAKDATFASASVNAAPTLGDHLTNKTYVDGILAANDAMIFKGTIGTGGTHTIAAFNALTTYNSGWTYRVVEAGTVRGKVVEIGDLITVIVDRTGSGNVDADFTTMQTNLDGAVIGPASTTDNYVALFSGATGKLLKAGTGALGTAAYVATGTFATAAQGTTADGAIPKATLTEQGDILYASAASTPAALAHGNVGQVLQSGGNGANPSWLTLGTMAAETATNYVLKSLWDAYSMLAATTDNTPAAFTVAEQTMVGRKTGGAIAALTPAEIINVICVAAPATKTSNGYAGQIAFDSNYFYRCLTGSGGAGTWMRSAMATNW